MRDFFLGIPALRHSFRIFTRCAALMLCGGVAIAEPARTYATPESATENGGDANQAQTLADCEQTDSAPRVVRACSLILNGQKLEPSERLRILILRGVGWSKEDEFQAATEDFSAAIEIDPANIAALEGRAKALSKLAEHSKSAADHGRSADDWSQLVALQPQNDKYYRLRGNQRLGAGQHQEALADFDKSLEINPQAIDAYIGRAHVYHALKDRQLADKEFKKGIEVNANYLPLHWARAEFAEAWGENKLAIDSYVEVLRINGVYEDARRRLQRLGVFTPP
jgi:tetratricopeptide (TPR) repeat protein